MNKKPQRIYVTAGRAIAVKRIRRFFNRQSGVPTIREKAWCRCSCGKVSHSK